MNNVALITGATSGIGYELAKCHAKHGDLIIVSRRREELNKVKIELESNFNIKVICIQKDLSVHNSAIELYNEVKQLDVKISYLINNAGIGLQGYFNSNEMDLYNKMIQLNIVSLTELTKLFLKDLVDNNFGRIMNVSSIAALQPGPMLSVYAATKSYVLSFSNGLYQEVKKDNITVTALIPGITNTNFGISSNMDKTKIFKKSKEPKSVAIKGYNAMLKGKLEVWAGVSFKLKMLLSFRNIVPKKIALKITMYLQK